VTVQPTQTKGTVIQKFVFLKSEHTVTTSGGTVTVTSCTAAKIVIFPTFVCESKRNVEMYRCCCRGADYVAIPEAKALHRLFQSKYQTFHPT
jgi:hypothetical protein